MKGRCQRGIHLAVLVWEDLRGGAARGPSRLLAKAFEGCPVRRVRTTPRLPGLEWHRAKRPFGRKRKSTLARALSFRIPQAPRAGGSAPLPRPAAASGAGV